MNDIAFSVIINNDGIDDIIFKTIMVKGEKGDGGIGIDHIEKTSTSGNVDTYTIYLEDGSVAGTFDVTNAILPETATIENVEIASFSDGADDVPVSELIVNIEPVQDLHGYDHPWVGGAGTNKWDEQWELGIINTTTGENQASNTQIRSINHIAVLPNTTYRLVVGGTGNWCAVEAYKSDKTFLQNLGGITGGATFTTPSDCYYIRFYASPSYGTTYNHDIAINNPSTVTTYSPYENICPISGWDECNVTDAGKNLFDNSLISIGSYSNNKWTISSPVVTKAYNGYFKPNTQYTFSCTATQGVASKNVRLQVIYTDGTIENLWSTNATTPLDVTFSSNPNKSISYIGCNYGSGGGSVEIDNFQIEFGSTATAYEAFKGGTETIDFGETTAFGGFLDVPNGKLTLDRAGVDLGTLTYSTPTNRAQTNALASRIKKPARASVISGCLGEKCYEVPATTNLNTVGQFAVLDNGLLVFYRDVNTPTGMLVYPLATPIVIQLTPAQVRTVLNDNNIFADTGKIQKVTYFKTGCEALARLIDAFK